MPKTATGFRESTPSASATQLANYLAVMSQLVGDQKRLSIERMALSAGDSALDIGCGTGAEVAHLAAVVGPSGRAVGVDVNPSLLELATAEHGSGNVEFVCADAHRLPFAAGEFAAARVERTLQHVLDPVGALKELARVVRPGGRVVAMEPDWHALVVPGDPDVAAMITRAVAGQARHPMVGRMLPEWLAAAGLDVEDVQGATLPMRSYALAERVILFEEATGALDPDEMARWREDMIRREADGTFLAAATGFIVTARVTDHSAG